MIEIDIPFTETVLNQQLERWTSCFWMDGCLMERFAIFIIRHDLESSNWNFIVLICNPPSQQQ